MLCGQGSKRQWLDAVLDSRKILLNQSLADPHPFWFERRVVTCGGYKMLSGSTLGHF
jgi:hypothetical protein